MRCVFCGHPGRPVMLPLVGRVLTLCSKCRGAAFIREMRRLVAHG